MSRIAHLFFDINMSSQHDGLNAILDKAVGSDELPVGDVALFINKKWTKLKILTADNTLIYLRRDEGINPETIRHIPNCIEGKDLNYGKALETAVKQRHLGLRPAKRKAK